MPIPSHVSIGLDLEDFRRLGIRPNEMRMSVIRRAAARSSRGLAEKQLAQPTPQTELQLARVVTSTYRLLDPRQRPNNHERAFVGRIMPNALNWAGQTKFDRSNGNDNVSSADENVLTISPVELESSANTKFLEDDELDFPEPETSSLWKDPVWQSNLRDDDLVNASHFSKQWKRFRTQFARRWLLATTSIVTIAAVAGLSMMRSANVVASRMSVEPKQQMVQLPPDTQANASASRKSDPITIHQPSESASPATKSATDHFPEARPDPESMEREPQPMHSNADRKDSFLPDPFAYKTVTSEPDTPTGSPAPVSIGPDSRPEESTEPKSGENPKAPLEPARVLHPRPDETDIRIAQQKLTSLLPELDKIGSVDDAHRAADRLETIADSLRIGTAEHWTVWMTAAARSWLFQDAESVEMRLRVLTENYDVVPIEVLAESFRSAPSTAHLPQDLRHLLEHGLPLLEQLLMSEAFDACEETAKPLSAIAQELESHSAREKIEQYHQAAQQMRRLSETVSKVITREGGLDAISEEVEEAGTLGRYYCLMLRRWDVGMPWLTQSTDPRIASVARQEMQLASLDTSSSCQTVAERWLAVSKRSTGRSSDSMHLRAIELMRRAVDLSDGLQKLELQRQLDERLETLPRHLRASRPTPTPTGSDATEVEPEVQTNSENRSGMRARIELEGNDIGVQIDYQPEVAITPGMLEQIMTRLGMEASPVTIHFVGDIEVADPIEMRFLVAASEENVTHQVHIDERSLLFEPDQQPASPGRPSSEQATAELASGTHTLRWTVKADDLKSKIFLAIQSAETGERIPVVQPSNSVDSLPPTTLTVSMLRNEE